MLRQFICAVALCLSVSVMADMISCVNAPVAAGQWDTLRVEFAGSKIAVLLDGKRIIDFTDDHISGAGSVGVWTKADSVTVFSEFAYQAARPWRHRE